MCDLATVALAGGTALQAASSISQGAAASRAGKMNAAISDSNARVVAARGAFEEAKVRDQVDRVLAGQRAYYADAGLDLTTGSPIATAAQSAAQGEVDAVLTRQKAQADSEGLKLQAEQQRAQARQAMAQGIFGAATTLLSGAFKWATLGGSSTPGNAVGGQIDIRQYARPVMSLTDPAYGGLY
jgi:hypothetical protein